MAPRVLTYCTNVHPYQDTAGMLAALDRWAVPLAQRLAREGPFPLGLWFPVDVARELAAEPGRLARELADRGLAVVTVNAFPYGAFHGERVKDAVFRPGWEDAERLRYTLQAAEVLAAALPEGTVGSLSTHSGGHKSWGCDEDAIVAGLLAADAGLADLEQRTGRRVWLAIEPEPCSFLETTDEVLDLFTRRLLPAGASRLGLCFDACHQAVEHEDLPDAVARLGAAGVPIAKFQLSSAIVLPDPAADRELLRPFAEDRWYHQVVTRDGDGDLVRVADLPEALADPELVQAPWRVHYHVPLFADPLDEQGRLRSTRDDLAALLRSAADVTETGHLEIETYTFDAIPAARRQALGAVDLLDCLEREFRWVEQVLAET